MTAFDLNEPREMDDVIRENFGKPVHVGSLMALCHIKNSEQYDEHTLPEDKVYKGRVVFRGDKVKDAHGMKAVFTELKTTASLLAASKMMDVIARLPTPRTQRRGFRRS